MRGSRRASRGTAGRSALWHHSSRAERAVAASDLVLLVVLAVLTLLEPAALPLTAALLVASTFLLLWLCLRARARRRLDQLLAAEATRGVEQLERWLATGPRR